MTQYLNIESQQGLYPVLFFSNIEELFAEIHFEREDIFIIIDEKVSSVYGAKLQNLLSHPTYKIQASESFKSLEEVSKFVEWLLSKGATKSSTILAVGGGIVQDIATFAAHIYKRGIKWEFLPTTLLSQSDSCIGAKCGINVYPYKNQIGVLHSPSRVFVVSEFLNTLEKEDFISGYGEILKLSLTPPENFFEEFRDSITQYGFDVNRVLPLLQRSLNAKKIIIEIDEYEKDLRRILNYGHSFGHALEAVTDNEVNHGYGVVFGIELINFLSTKWGFLDLATKSAISDLIRLTFPINFLPRKISAAELIQALRTDKKVASGKINFVVLTTEMKLVILPKYIDQELESLVDEYLENECIFITS